MGVKISIRKAPPRGLPFANYSFYEWVLRRGRNIICRSEHHYTTRGACLNGAAAAKKRMAEAEFDTKGD